MMPSDYLFVDLQAAARKRQFRMSRLQMFNWGTFSDLHEIPIAEEGFLFVGRSGSGKSTLLDAISSLLVPPQWLSFNTAAREGDGGRYDRNLAAYVRGAWADKKDADSGEIATHYLRTRTTWSALALEFANRSGRVVTLVQLYWLRGSANRNADVRKHFMIAERPFNIATELEGFALDVRSLKQRLGDLHHYDKFRPYGERFRRLLSIDSEVEKGLNAEREASTKERDALVRTVEKRFADDRASGPGTARCGPALGGAVAAMARGGGADLDAATLVQNRPPETARAAPAVLLGAIGRMARAGRALAARLCPPSLVAREMAPTRQRHSEICRCALRCVRTGLPAPGHGAGVADRKSRYRALYPAASGKGNPYQVGRNA
jgi:energy-coupling factor transporter ATP-binding protein EcfA2